jgi:hypothetical protein
VAWQFGEVFAEQAVTPSQEQVKTPLTPASDLRQGVFRQHRRKADIRETPTSVKCRYCCKSRKPNDAENLAKADF